MFSWLKILLYNWLLLSGSHIQFVRMTGGLSMTTQPFLNDANYTLTVIGLAYTSEVLRDDLPLTSDFSITTTSENKELTTNQMSARNDLKFFMNNQVNRDLLATHINSKSRTSNDRL